MRKTTDLFELDFVFSQQPLLTPEQFINEYKRTELYSNPGLVLWDVINTTNDAEYVPLAPVALAVLELSA
jgi:hypothetical protein